MKNNCELRATIYWATVVICLTYYRKMCGLLYIYVYLEVSFRYLFEAPFLISIEQHIRIVFWRRKATLCCILSLLH